MTGVRRLTPFLLEELAAEVFRPNMTPSFVGKTVFITLFMLNFPGAGTKLRRVGYKAKKAGYGKYLSRGGHLLAPHSIALLL
jgi:hypothetical protein